MPTLDVFKADAFSMASLTAAINALPYQPKMLGDMGLFSAVPVTTTVAYIEKREGKLSVIPSAPRGTMPNVQGQRPRVMRALTIPHIPSNQTIRADDVQNIRAFGSETELETVSGVVNDALAGLRADHETTFEWHRKGALQGIVYDADGSTVIHNLFTEFGETEVEVDFALQVDTTDVKGQCTATIRAVEDSLGADVYTELVAFCGDEWYDAFVSHPNVVAAYANWNSNVLDQQQRAQGFPFAGINFKNYRGNSGGSPWIATDIARIAPVGVMNLFQHVMAPGDMIDTVNTRGQAIYAKQEILDYGKGIGIHTQSNPLMLCTRPKCLIKLTTSGP